MIVDAHAHLGYDEVFDVDFTEAELVEGQEQNGIDITLVQPPTVHDLAGVKRHHDAVADLARRRPGRYYGIACPNPHLPGNDYETEVRRCVEQLGFVGLKLHPLGRAFTDTPDGGGALGTEDHPRTRRWRNTVRRSRTTCRRLR